jgi:hypothetical protein
MEIGASSQDEKDTVGGILLADKSLAAGINLLHSDGALRSLIRQKQVPLGKVLMLIETAVNIKKRSTVVSSDSLLTSSFLSFIHFTKYFTA